MDRIFLNKMEFYGYHGAFPEENRLGQRFIVDLVLELDISISGKTDALKDTVNYADIYQSTKEIVEGKPFKLIETVAEELAATLLQAYEKIQVCTVKIIKPDPPIPGHYESVAVEIKRGRL